MPEEAELNFIHYLKRRDASPNTIKSCLASCRLYYSLFDELNTTNLMLYKDYLVQHYTAATVNNRIYGINRYLDCIGMALDNKGPDSDGSRAASDNTGFPSDCHRDSRDAFHLPGRLYEIQRFPEIRWQHVLVFCGPVPGLHRSQGQ